MIKTRNFIFKKYLGLSSSVLKYLKELEKAETFSEEEIKRTQEEKLYNLLIHSIKNVDYYNNTLSSIDCIRQLDKFKIENIKKVPFLTKDIIRQNFERLTSKDKIRRKTFFNTSGGSTGEPVKLMQDEYYSEYKRAVKILFNKWSGCDLGDKQVRLWGSERDLFKGREFLRTSLGKWLRNEVWLNAFHVTPQSQLNFVQEINKFKPKQILAYVDSIYELASYIEKERIGIYSPYSIMVTAGTLAPEMRDTIEKVFGAKIFNRYGSREVGDIACECEQHIGLHISPLTHYVEILDPYGKEVEPGQVGEIVITSLTNFSMPLIRYKIGDLGSWSNEKCPCGRNWPFLENITGRISDIFLCKDGSEVHGEFFTHLFYFKDWVEKFQIVQEDYDRLEIYLVPGKNKHPNSTEIDEILEKIKLIMGNSCKVNFNFVQDIKKTDSGKFRYTISKLKNRFS